MHAATLAWAYTGDPALAREARSCRRRTDPLPGARRLSRHLLARQALRPVRPATTGTSGRTSTILIGLLTYYQYTGDPGGAGGLPQDGRPAHRHVSRARRASSPPARTWAWPRPACSNRSCCSTGATGDERYLEFARYIVNSWDEPGGPQAADHAAHAKSRSTRRPTARPTRCSRTWSASANWRARPATSNSSSAVLNAWQDIVDKRLYITGSASAASISAATTSCPTASRPISARRASP